MKQVRLSLEGVLQAWGVDDALQRRRTHNQPQRRTVFGLIRAAKGLKRHESWEALETLDFKCETQKAGHRMWDFASMSNIIRANGKGIQDHAIQEKEYLADAAFIVTLTGEDHLIDEVIVALENPVFILGLGRRDCMPTQPILLSYGVIEEQMPNLERPVSNLPSQ